MKIKYNEKKTTMQLLSGNEISNILFGTFFLIPGFIFIVATLNEKQSSDDNSLYAGLVFGSVFFITGLIISLGRKGVLIDLENQKIIKWYGLLVPLKKESYDLSIVEKVIITKETRRSKNSTYNVYPVKITFNKGSVYAVINRDYLRSRRAGEKTAHFLRKSLSDQSQGTYITRDWDKLDESLRDRILRTSMQIQNSKLPQDSNIKVNQLHSSLEVDIAGGKFNSGVLVIFLIIISFEGMFFLPMISVIKSSPNPIAAMLPIVGMAVIPLVIFIIIIFRSGGFYSQPLKVKATRENLDIYEGKKHSHFKVDDIEEIIAKTHLFSSGITIITDNTLYCFADFLKGNEINFLKNAILKVISS